MTALAGVLAAGSPSPLDPKGSEASRLASIFWILLVLGTAVALLVLGAVIVALFRRSRVSDEPGTARLHQRFIVGGGIVLPVVVLTVVAVVTVDGTATLRRPAADQFRVEVIGEQWFWRVNYADAGVTSADELRLPVDRPVEIKLTTNDVIHSFWVPQLAGKLDLSPDTPTYLRFTPRQTGTFRGECAEFCGLQHANMNFVVDVMPQADFDRWLRDHQRPPPGPTDALALEGRQQFASLACAGCHTIRGLTNGTLGPDLTDVASRSTLGAGTVPNNDENMATWIVDARVFKPGVKMPPMQLTSDQVDALVAYLRTLR